MTAPRLRTINAAHKAIKELDPETAISAKAIRELVKTGRIPCVKSGNRVYVNLDTLLDCLEHPDKYPDRRELLKPVQGVYPVAE